MYIYIYGHTAVTAGSVRNPTCVQHARLITTSRWSRWLVYGTYTDADINVYSLPPVFPPVGLARWKKFKSVFETWISDTRSGSKALKKTFCAVEIISFRSSKCFFYIFYFPAISPFQSTWTVFGMKLKTDVDIDVRSKTTGEEAWRGE